MVLSKKEKQTIIILRLLKEVSQKNDNGYYSLSLTPQNINRKVYLPEKGHCEFESPEETISTLKGYLKMSPLEYKYDLIKMNNRLNKLKEKSEEAVKEFNSFKELYDIALEKLGEKNVTK